MRWYETTSRILLILSVINFAFAAPVAVRDIHEVRVDTADVAKDGTSASQSQTRKRLDSWAQWTTTNAVDRTGAPPRPRVLENWFEQSPPTSPETSVASNSAPESPVTSIASNSAPPTPVTPTTSDSAPSSPGSPSGPHGGASPEYGTSHSQGDPSQGSFSSWDSGRLTLSSQWLVDDPDNPATPDSVTGPPQTPPPSSPVPSTGSPPSKDGRPPPSPGPDVNPPPSSGLQHPAEHESESFLEKLLKGRIRRHISGPDAAYAAQRELEGSVDPTTSTLRDLAKN